MKTKLTLLIIYNLSFIIYSSLYAQNIGINGTGANAHASALLDVDDAGTNTKGILIPRIPLTAINVSTPVTSPATSLLVYNTASASTGTNAVSPGYYYWDGLKWVRFSFSASGSSANDWNILGNAGTVAGTNFIGTTDNVNLVFKRNNIKAGFIGTTQSTSFGEDALINPAGFNSAFGYSALKNNTSGGSNTACGNSSLVNNTTGGSNTACGIYALQSNISGNGNTGVGNWALQANTTGSNNVGVGSFVAIQNSTGSNNTFLGSNTDVTINNLTNATAIGYNAKVGQSNALILGGTGSDAVNVGIGTTIPNEKFTIENGNMQLGESMPATGLGRQLFFSDIPNNAFDPIYFQRQNISSDFSNLNLSIGDNYNVGYSNDKFNIGAGYSSGVFNSVLTVEMGNSRVGINTTTPTEKLEVQGSVKIVDGTQGAGRVLTSDAAGKASWKEAAINTNKFSHSEILPANVAVPTPGFLITLGSPFTIATTGIYRVLVDATIPQGMILGIDNQSLSNSILYATVSNRYYAQYFVYVIAGTHNLILYNDANSPLTPGGPYWNFVIEGPIN